MWLLDVNVPQDVCGLLRGFGIESHHTRTRGWHELKNGVLVEAASTNGFDCVLTRDRLFGESAARALQKFPQFAVVLVTIPQTRGAEFLGLFREEWVRTPLRPVPGRLIRWPA